VPSPLCNDHHTKCIPIRDVGRFFIRPPQWLLIGRKLQCEAPQIEHNQLAARQDFASVGCRWPQYTGMSLVKRRWT